MGRPSSIARVTVAAVALLACEGSSPPARDTPAVASEPLPADAPAASATPPATSAATPSASTAAIAEPKKGLYAPGNDAEAVKEIEKVRDGCKWSGKEFAGTCKQLSDWYDWASWPGRNDITATLVAVLEDDDPAVHDAAAVGLEVIGTRPISDAKVATTLFDALEAERNPANCRGIGMQAASVRLKETGLDERAKKVVKSHVLSPCRVALLGGFLSYNPQHYDFTVEIAKTDADVAVRAAAMESMRDATGEERQRNNCKLWLEILEANEDELANKAAGLLGATSRSGAECVEEWDPMLTRVEALVATEDGPSGVNDWGVARLLEQKRATEAQKARGLGICRKIAENTANPDAIRASALTCVGAHDPDAKTFAKPFENDAGAQVKAAAKRILESTK